MTASQIAGVLSERRGEDWWGWVRRQGDDAPQRPGPLQSLDGDSSDEPQADERACSRQVRPEQHGSGCGYGEATQVAEELQASGLVVQTFEVQTIWVRGKPQAQPTSCGRRVSTAATRLRSTREPEFGQSGRGPRPRAPAPVSVNAFCTSMALPASTAARAVAPCWAGGVATYRT